jgi:hypothetical protein
MTRIPIARDRYLIMFVEIFMDILGL